MRSLLILVGVLVLASGSQFAAPLSAWAQHPCSGDAQWTGYGDGRHWSDPENWLDQRKPGLSMCSITVKPEAPEVGTRADGGPYSTNSLAHQGTLQMSADITIYESLSLTIGSLINGLQQDPGEPDLPGFGGGTLDLQCACSISAPFVMRGNGATLRGSQTITLDGPFKWTAGKILADVDVSDGTVDGDDFPNDLHHELDGTLTIPVGGVVRWTGSDDIAGNGRIVNHGLFTIDPEAGKEVRMIPSGIGLPLFANYGEIVQIGAGRAEIRWPTDIEQVGEINVDSGTLAITGYGTRAGPADVAAGATLEFGDRLSAPGDGRVTDFLGGITGLGNLEFRTGAAIHRVRAYAHAGAVGVTGRVEFETGREVTLTSLRIGDATNSSIQGTLGGSDPVTVVGPTTLYTAMAGGSSWITALAGIEKVGGSLLTLDGRSLRNGGIFDWQAGEIWLYNGAALVQLPGSSLAIDGARSLITSGPGYNDFVNAGLVRILPGAELSATTDFVQTGGELRMEGGAVTAWQGLQLQGGSITGSGTIRGGVTNTGGTVAPGLSPGLLALQGPYSQSASGRFALEIGGAAEGQRDRLTVSTWVPFAGFFRFGNVSLAGTLDVDLIGGYVAPSHASFPFIALDGTLSGTFGAVFGPDGRKAAACPGPGSTSVVAILDQVGCSSLDADSDGIPDALDNCPYYASAILTDTDGDGRGDVCECTDEDGDGRNTVSDLVAINRAIFNPSLATPLCDGNNDGLCNVTDIVSANAEIFSPRSTSTCSRQPVPGP